MLRRGGEDILARNKVVVATMAHEVGKVVHHRLCLEVKISEHSI
jgi:hypothetical protein